MQHVEGQDAAAAIVNVVRVAVVRRAEGHDRLQRRRAVGGHLERVEPAPGDSPHADGARTPRLLGEPGDELEGVLLLLFGVFVLEDPVGLARPTHVNADRRVPKTGQVRLALGVPGDRAVVLAVGEKLEDGRHGILVGVVGKPDPGCEPAAVRERDPGVLDLPHAPRELGPDAGGHVTTRSRTRRSRL